MQLPVGMAKPEHQSRRAEIAGDADNSAVDGPLTLDLDPITPATGRVGPIDALGEHTFEPGNLKPGFSDVHVRRVRHELEARMARHEQSLEGGEVATSDDLWQWQRDQSDAAQALV